MDADQYQCFLRQDVEVGHFDLTFRFKDRRELLAHRHVVKPLSRVFSAMLQADWKEGIDGVVDVLFAYEEFKNFLNFCYAGDCAVNMENFESVISIAEYYQADALKEYAQTVMMRKYLSLEEAMQLVEFCRESQLDDLKQMVHRRIQVSFREIVTREDPLTLDNSIANEIIQEIRQYQPPQDVFQFGFDWTCKKVMDQEKHGTYRVAQLVVMFKTQFVNISEHIPLHKLDEKALKYGCSHAPFFSEHNAEQFWNAVLNEED